MASNVLARGASPCRFAAWGGRRRWLRPATSSIRSEVRATIEIDALSTAFNRMTEELAGSHATLEGRIAERTRDQEAVRDLLDAFFRISTSWLDPGNIDKTFDSVLRLCSKLGYDLAMISLADREAGVIRTVRATGTIESPVVLE